MALDSGWFFLGDVFSAILGLTVVPFCVSLRGLLMFVARGLCFYGPCIWHLFFLESPTKYIMWNFLGDPFRKRSYIQRFLIRL